MLHREGRALRRGRHPLLVTEGVLFPATALDYHFVEEDRQQLVRRALVDDGYLVVRAKEEVFTSDIATLATILDYWQPSGARTFVKLGGVERVRLCEMHPSEEPAVVVWQRVDEVFRNRRACESVAADVLGILDSLEGVGFELAGEVSTRAARAADVAAVADIVGAVTFDTPEEQRRLLDETDVLTRLLRVSERLGQLAELSRPYRTPAPRPS
jgi:Lon protease-like protein